MSSQHPFSSHSIKQMLLLCLALAISSANADISIGGGGSGIGIGIGGGGSPGIGIGGGGSPGIGIGIGIGGSPPPPSEPRPPRQRQLQRCDFLNDKQYEAYLVIQRFKTTITCDPMGITRTWCGARPCNYTGFLCATPPNTKEETIASVDFNPYKLSAPNVCGFIDQLKDIALFHANSNKFGGSVPDLRRSKYLYELDMSNNLLSGPFPTDLLALKQLIFLDIRFNKFKGGVPPGVFKLDLDVLFLNNNGFSGPIPSNLGQTPAVYLTLANNFFTGPIPASIGNTSKTLLEVLFLNNSLSGCLPFEIGLLSKSTVFDAGLNKLTGEIPLSFGCLKKMEQLNFAGNLLYGLVPDVLCNLAIYGERKLTNLSLSDNYFHGIGPSCLSLIKNGVLDVRRNCIPGLKDQRPTGECARFYEHPKYCPFLPFIPCELPHLGGGRKPPSSHPAAKPLHPPRKRGPPSVTYQALLHNKDGN